MAAQAHSAAQRVLPIGGLGEPLEGAVEIAASCSLAQGLPNVAQLLADAVKGHLPGTLRPLQVILPPSCRMLAQPLQRGAHAHAHPMPACAMQNCT